MTPVFLKSFAAPLLASLFLSLPLCGNELEEAPSSDTAPASVLRVAEADDQILRVRTKVRHTTIVVLPRAEEILDFVVGDSDYWHLTGSANVAYLKPLAEDLKTNVTLVCASGKIYVFLVEEDDPPHLVVRIEREAADERSTAPAQPAFVARTMVEGYQRAAQQATAVAQAAEEDARSRIAVAQNDAQASINDFRSTYPHKLRWPYRLERSAFQPPFSVEAMWADNRFTYLRSVAQEAPALYELKDGKPSLVAYDLEDDGLFVVRHLLADGWLQIGEKKARWRVVPED